MSDMTQTPAHAKPARRNHLWILFAIAFPAAVEVWASWVGVGSRSGFPVIRLPFGVPAFSTGFSLAVGMEAYWGYALYVWLVAGPGPKSRKFAMQSAIGAFLLSLLGQIAYHLMLAEHVAATPVIVVVFVAALPVTLLALVAFLIHLMHADRGDAGDAEVHARAEAERTQRDAAEASELAMVRAELETARGALEPARADLATARAEMGRLAARAETLERKLATATGRKQPRKPAGATGRKPAAATAPETAAVTGSATAPETDGITAPEEAEAPEDLDSEAKVLWYLDKGLSASRAGIAAGLTDSRGRQIARLRKPAPKGQDPEE